MHADGTGQRNVSNHRGVDSSPTWSPDSQRIAFLSSRDGGQHIYTVNVDGSGLTRLTNGPDDETDAVWSPR